ncbi:MAG: site-specific integrase, partial [Dehalococcoidia bacterium]|nr:site-specific integrase [Dehalococcoidia bacterium]
TLGGYRLKQITPIVLDDAFKRIQANGGVREFCTLRDADAFQTAMRAVKGSYSEIAAKGIVNAQRMRIIAGGGRAFKSTAQAIAEYCRVPLESLFTACPAQPLNSNTIREVKQMLGAVLSAATRKGIIRFNPISNTEPIKAAPFNHIVMNNEQTRLFLSMVTKLENISMRALLVTALFTGMRSGELRALHWADIDTRNGIIRVNKNLDDMGNITTTKTKSSSRYVPIAQQLAMALEQYHGELRAHIESMGGCVADKGIVFPSITTGDYMSRGIPNLAIKSLIRNTDLPQGLHLHSLRHGFASLAINDGADAKVVQGLLGHASVTITQDIYSHIFGETQAKYAQRITLSVTSGNSIFSK